MSGLRRATVVALALLAAACVVVGPPREIDAHQQDSTVDLTVGQELVVRLDANPTTGYRWVMASGATGVLTQVGELNYAPRSLSAPMVGSGGVTTARFRAATPGRQTLELAYRRPWERDTPAAKTFRVDVVVGVK